MRLKFAALLLAATTTAVAVTALAPSPARAAEDKVVNVYNWSDYVAPDTLSRFTSETGIKVNYDVYDNNDIVTAKLSAGKSGYDVVFPTVMPHFANQLKAGLYRTLDRTKAPNFANLDAAVLAKVAAADPGNAHGAPYMIAATGFAFNADKIAKAMPGAPTDSWAMLLDPAVVARFKGCGVSLLDDPVEVFPATLAFLGRDPLSTADEDLKAATAHLKAVRPSIKYFHSSQYINDIANGDLCVAHGYVGDLVQARARAEEAKNGVRIVIVIPREGAVMNNDVMAIPTDAPHPDNAHAFIDFILRPDVIGAITNATGYANAVPASAAVVSEAVRTDPAIYPPDAVRAKTFSVPPVDAKGERARTRAWTSVKAGT